MKYTTLAVAASLLWMFPTFAADWPAFRGPKNDGVSDEVSVPTHWTSTENVAWRFALPRPANGSPIVIGDHVFVTSAEDDDGKRRSLYCLDIHTGSKQWVQTVSIDRKMPTHNTNPYAGTTPASDGQRVVVWHASAGLFCYNLAGEQLWQRQLGEFAHMWGYGSSPIVFGKRIILHTGPSKTRSFVTVLDASSGETIWEVDEPFEGDGDHNADGKYMGSWSTPVMDLSSGSPHVIVMQPTRVTAYDVDTGKITWFCRGLNHPRGDLAYSSPVLTGGLCFVTGGYQGPAMGIRLGGAGDVTSSHRLWRTTKNPQSIGSGVAVSGYVYRPNTNPGSIECIDPQTGRTLWKERATKAGFWASILRAGDHLYATDQDGTTIVFRPKRKKLDPVARNALGEPCNATPAIANSQLFIRTAEHLYAIGER